MSDEADMLMDRAQEWADSSVVCPHHGVRHLDSDQCPVCEDGEEFHDWWHPTPKYRGTQEDK